jgi:hypothetical protein
MELPEEQDLPEKQIALIATVILLSIQVVVPLPFQVPEHRGFNIPPTNFIPLQLRLLRQGLDYLALA